MTTRPLPSRATIERAVEALIDLLDELDGDADLELEHDAGADDRGEPAGLTFRPGAPNRPVDSDHACWLQSNDNPPCSGQIA